MNKKPNAADTLRRALARHGEVKTDATDSIRESIDPREPTAPLEWYDRVIAIGEAQDALEQKWEAKRKAEEEKAKTPEPTTAGVLTAAIAKAATGSNSAIVPLNGAALLKSAIAAMGTGTINNGSGE